MITKTFEEAWKEDEVIRIKESLSKDKNREYFRKRILEIEDIKANRGNYERKTLAWAVPEYQKPKKNKKTLLGLILANF